MKREKGSPRQARPKSDTPLWAWQDPWLAPCYETMEVWQGYITTRRQLFAGLQSLSSWTCGHLYSGLHHTDDGQTAYEYASVAQAIYLLCDANQRHKDPNYRSAVDEERPGEWLLKLPATALHHLGYYKLPICTDHEELERTSVHAHYVVQNPQDCTFCTRIWVPEEPYLVQTPTPQRPDILLIYERHIGMNGEEMGVASYEQFRMERLPYIVSTGYNMLQVMAVQEHPCYDLYGYYISNFFAPSSRFGTPDDLKRLVDEAYILGLYVIMDLIHSYAVRDKAESLAHYDGTQTFLFHEGSRGEYSQWDSFCFGYGRSEMVHFLPSSCHCWLTECGFDGFRFDGVTSMLYEDHSLGRPLLIYADYYSGNVDRDTLTYLTFANEPIHVVKPSATTITEEVNGLPELYESQATEGYGLDYRLVMNVPDYQVKLIKEQPDETWNPENTWYELHNHRPPERTISYVEGYSQALIGDKIIVLRLINSDMHWHVQQSNYNDQVIRDITLYNMIHSMASATMCGGYLTFMGNEFGYPEWIDLPREGNGYSYRCARRQWSLQANGLLRCKQLTHFDKGMLSFCRSTPCFVEPSGYCYRGHMEQQIIAFMRGDDYLFAFNSSPTESYTDYLTKSVPAGQYEPLLDSDTVACGGFRHIDANVLHHTHAIAEGGTELRLYLPSHSTQVYQCKQ